MSSTESINLRKLQTNFQLLFNRWINYGAGPKTTTVHLPHVVCLLQSVGYQLSRIELLDPSGITRLRNNLQGTRVVITCGHSGQRLILESPDECSCLTKNTTSDYYEVTGKNKSLIESGSGIIPKVSKEVNILLRNVLILLTHHIQGTQEEVNTDDYSIRQLNSMYSRATSSPNKGGQDLQKYIPNMSVLNPPVILSSPNRRSPVRNSLGSSYALSPSQSSPNINVCINQQITNIHNSGNDKVVDLLHEAIKELKKKPSTTPKKAIISKEKSTSSPNLSSRKTFVKSPVPNKKPAITPAKSSPACCSNNSNCKNTKSVGNKVVKKPGNPSYAHVKSTIPRPSPTTKITKKA